MDGYLIPAVPDPADYSCFKVYVPKDDMYISQFWTAYNYFTVWVAWARDPLRRGKKAAEAWRRAYDKARAEFELSKGVCEMNVTGVRQDPLNPCALQVEFDGNNQWVTVADISKCAGSSGGGDVLRFNGTTVQRYDACAQAWVDAGPTTSPAFAGASAGAWVGNPDGACLAAANVAESIDNGKLKMTSLVGAGASFGALALEGLGGLAIIVPGAEVFEPMIAFLDGAYTYLATNYAAVAAIALDNDLPCVLVPYFKADGSITQSNLDLMVARIQALVDASSDEAFQTAYRYAISWINAAGPNGLTKAGKSAGITAYDCSSCGWEHSFDFLAEKGGWLNAQVDTGVIGGGHWEAGQGWLSDYVVNSVNGGGYTRIDLHRLIPSTTLNYIRIVYNIVRGTTGTDPYFQQPWNTPYPGGSALASQHVDTVDGENVVAEWTFSTPVTDLVLYMQAGQDFTGGDPGGSLVLKEMTIRGDGTDPF
jgi:hypothetical protein